MTPLSYREVLMRAVWEGSDFDSVMMPIKFFLGVL